LSLANCWALSGIGAFLLKNLPAGLPTKRSF